MKSIVYAKKLNIVHAMLKQWEWASNAVQMY